MWGYQPHFRVGQKTAAEHFFQKIDKRLKPAVFVVGILAPDEDGHFPASVEPEDEYWIQSEDFNDVPTIAKQLRGAYPEAAMFQSPALAQQRQDEDLFKRSIQDSVRQVIASHPSKPAGVTFHVSYPARIGSYLVCAALGLQDSVTSTYPALRRTYVEMHKCRHIPVSVSFIDAAVGSFLEQATDELLTPDPGAGISHRDSDELLRSAGDRLMIGLVWRVDQNCLEGMHGLFRSITTISSLRYEKAAGAGGILIARKDHPSIAEKVAFATPVELTSYRSVRKLLELASDEFPIYCDPDRIYGLAQVAEYDGSGEDLFEVQITGYHHWELRHAGEVLMTVQYGLPALPKLPFDEEKFRTDLPRIFRQIPSTDIDRLVGLVRVAERETHGTMLVISEAAEREAARLAPQGTPIRPLLLDGKILKNLTPIDGAIILDPAGTCYAIGTILDGKATKYGDPGRGARYNSAIRYYESAEAPCMIIVISSDGGVDIVPNPPPSIRRSLIHSAIEKMTGFETASQISRRDYRDTLDWLDDHRFYLLEDDCKILNEKVDKLEERIRREDQATVWIVRSPFKPNPAMNPALYYLEE